MADRRELGPAAEEGAEGMAHTSGAAQPRSVAEARQALDATRQRMSADLDVIEARLRGAAGDLRERLNLLEPARARIRTEVWTSLAIAFGVGLAHALLTAPRRDGRRGPLARMLRTTARRLPAAVFAGVRAGVADRLEDEWRGRGALPAPRSRGETRPLAAS